MAPATDFGSEEGRKVRMDQTYTVDLPPREDGVERDGMRPRAGVEVEGGFGVGAGGIAGGMGVSVGTCVSWLVVMEDVEDDEEAGGWGSGLLRVDWVRS